MMSNRKKTLRELSVLASQLYGKAKTSKFRRDIACFMCLLNSQLSKKVESDYLKLYFKLWPPGSLQNDLGIIVMRDTVPNVLGIDIELDIDSYLNITVREERFKKLENIMIDWLEYIPDDIDIDLNCIAEGIASLEEHNYEYYREYGRWIMSPSKEQLVKLWASCRATGIEIGVKIQDRKTNEVRNKIFARYELNHITVIDEIGRVKFTDEDTLVYTPMSYYAPNIFHIGSIG